MDYMKKVKKKVLVGFASVSEYERTFVAWK